MDEGHYFQYFVGLARIRERKHDILGRDHAQIAVKGLGRMQEETRRAGAGQRRGYLAGYMSRLAHARDDEFAAARENQLDGTHELVAQCLLHVFECQRLGMYRTAADLYYLLRCCLICHNSVFITGSRSSRYNILGPSERALSGSGCTSKK